MSVRFQPEIVVNGRRQICYELTGVFSEVSRPQYPEVPHITQSGNVITSTGHHFFAVDHDGQKIFFEGDGTITQTILE